jgi:pSer/pThr/pTyr-binding forkhead associated (FHA) protein
MTGMPDSSTMTDAPQHAAAGAEPDDVGLLLIRDHTQPRRFVIPDGSTTIGRRQDCSLRIALGNVSRRHCQLSRDGRDIRVLDLGSSNGTFVNGRRVQESPLLPGDRVQVGSLTFVLQVDGKPAESEAVTATSGDVLHDSLADDATSHLSPTAQADAGEARQDWVLDPSGAAADVEELMND